MLRFPNRNIRDFARRPGDVIDPMVRRRKVLLSPFRRM